MMAMMITSECEYMRTLYDYDNFSERRSRKTVIQDGGDF